MRHAFGTCATAGGIRTLTTLGSTDEEALGDGRWGRYAQAALRSLPCQAGITRTNERAYLPCIGTRCAVTVRNGTRRQTGR
jgi:hypothetical protein